jgi:hypothetical protein
VSTATVDAPTAFWAATGVSFSQRSSYGADLHPPPPRMLQPPSRRPLGPPASSMFPPGGAPASITTGGALSTFWAATGASNILQISMKFCPGGTNHPLPLGAPQSHCGRPRRPPPSFSLVQGIFDSTLFPALYSMYVLHLSPELVGTEQAQTMASFTKRFLPRKI